MKSIGFGNGMLTGFIATLVLSALMIMKAMMGVMPKLDVIAMLSNMAGASSPLLGWLLHFAIGTFLWGVGFALLVEKLPGRYWMKGVIFATGAWVLMMLLVMPMAGAGLFGMNLGIMAPIMTLILHIIFGVVLGGVYRKREKSSPSALRPS